MARDARDFDRHNFIRERTLRLLRRIDLMRERGEDPHLEATPHPGHMRVRLQVRNLDLRARARNLDQALAHLEDAYVAQTGLEDGELTETPIGGTS